MKISKDLYHFIQEYKTELDCKEIDEVLNDAWNNTDLDTDDYINLCILIRGSVPNALEYMNQIPRYFYYQSDFKEFKIPKNIEHLKTYCFSQSTDLNTVYIPKSVKDIARGCFNGCVDLINVYYEGSEEEWYNLVKNLYSWDPLHKLDIHFNTEM